jgi:hypothetical protein
MEMEMEMEMGRGASSRAGEQVVLEQVEQGAEIGTEVPSPVIVKEPAPRSDLTPNGD